MNLNIIWILIIYKLYEKSALDIIDLHLLTFTEKCLSQKWNMR